MARLLSALYAKRAIKHNRLVCFGGVKLAGFDRVSFDAIIGLLAAIMSADNKGHLELSTCASQSAYRLIVCLSICLSATFMLNISELSDLGVRVP